MIKPLGNGRLGEFLTVLKYILWGFVVALVLVAVLFLKTHWIGFTKFIDDPKFFDGVKVEREWKDQ